ncbi:hypothetical protein SAMN04487895_101670 [Paenibacillus sophorae]|uniref:Uncharacterized protein n=1 Tax=Paenibacillus sophorae TaxID=1333845 RepID=A0A1H8GWK2_9BACL|nr:hypothetical protein [Paenibacillus sophorae]QWU14365.1 hypothetical protein KP014_20885 [Paenibacillus sophorae]SEN48373.1 hypothetical protein SAMN04487895_101670 [Paenibacillus sophorae]
MTETETEAILRRKARRIKRASEMVEWLRYDIEHTGVSEVEKQGLLKTITLLSGILRNDDKEDNIWNR